VLPDSENKMLINCRGELMDLSRPKVMGIINLTPDSFYEKSRENGKINLFKRIEQMIKEDVDIIDLGAYSSRPNADHISEQDELNRSSIVYEISKEFPKLITSIDTFRSKVAIQAIENGASIINDISGGDLDANMFGTVSRLRVPYIMMHMKGTPQNMNSQTNYNNLLIEITKYFSKKINTLKLMGVNDIILDPGFGFAKNLTQNFKVLNHLNQFEIFGLPVLVGLSRKSFISKTLSIDSNEALNGTTVMNTIALNQGAKILRVHDVKEAKQAIQLFQALQNS